MTRIPAWINGQLTPTDKLDVHLRGLRHKAVSVFVLRGQSVLLQRRAFGKYHTPGLWANTCCTHPLWEEDSKDCAVRRLEEELGLTGLDPVFRHNLEYRADVGGGMVEHECVDVFCAQAPENLAVYPNPTEVMDVQWIQLNDLLKAIESHPERYTPWLRIYLANHQAQIFGGPVEHQV